MTIEKIVQSVTEEGRVIINNRNLWSNYPRAIVYKDDGTVKPYFQEFLTKNNLELLPDLTVDPDGKNISDEYIGAFEKLSQTT